MNYIMKYGLEYNPFIKNSNEVYYESRDYRAAMVS